MKRITPRQIAAQIVARAFENEEIMAIQLVDDLTVITPDVSKEQVVREIANMFSKLKKEALSQQSA